MTTSAGQPTPFRPGLRAIAVGMVLLSTAASGSMRAASVRQTAQPPVTISTTRPDSAADTLVIEGNGFAVRSLVTLNLIPLTLRSITSTRIVAAAPIARMPPGTYVLTVSRGPAPGDTATTVLALPEGTSPPLALTANGAATPAAPIPGGGDVAATVGDRALTVAEVDGEWQRSDPAGYLAAQRRIYEARHRALQTLLSSELVAREAAAQGLSPAALLAVEVPKRRVPLPDVAVAAAYQSLGERARGLTFEELQPAIRAWLAEITEPELAKMTFTEELMKVATKVDVRLKPPRTEVTITAGDPGLGPGEAAVTVVLFTDLLSPDYARLATALPRIRQTYGARLRLVFKALTDGVLPEAAAQAASCAHAQGRFWPFHDVVVASVGFVDSARLKRLAGDAGLDRDRFDSCFGSDAVRDVAPRAAAEAARHAISASPSLVVNGVLAPPPPPFLPPFEYLQRLIEEALRARAAPPGGR